MLLKPLVALALFVPLGALAQDQDVAVQAALNTLAACDRHLIPSRSGDPAAFEPGWEDCADVQTTAIRMFEALQAGRQRDQADLDFMAQKEDAISGRR